MIMTVSGWPVRGLWSCHAWTNAATVLYRVKPKPRLWSLVIYCGYKRVRATFPVWLISASSFPPIHSKYLTTRHWWHSAVSVQMHLFSEMMLAFHWFPQSMLEFFLVGKVGGRGSVYLHVHFRIFSVESLDGGSPHLDCLEPVLKFLP